ncbi:hypothetical protein [Actinopolymorpha sp. B11F2]|uniref:hypothetical protein n=1 Tax=Actinopolymorpha sp. B11F2 TaxID=3160862 RepID=UPI0032E3F319
MVARAASEEANATMSTERATPFYCPYCGEEDLRPAEDSHGAWECRGCTRAFSLKFIGLVVRS